MKFLQGRTGIPTRLSPEECPAAEFEACHCRFHLASLEVHRLDSSMHCSFWYESPASGSLFLKYSDILGLWSIMAGARIASNSIGKCSAYLVLDT